MNNEMVKMNVVVAEELKGGNEMKNINHKQMEVQGEKALVLYNRVSKEDIRWGQRVKTGNGETMELLSEELVSQVNLVDFQPVFQLNKKLWSIKQAGMQDFLLPVLSVEELEEILPFALGNIDKESSYVKTLLSQGVRVFDGRTGVKAELSGNSNEVVYATYTNLLLNETVDTAKLIAMEPGFISVSSNRAGSAGVINPATTYRSDVHRRGIKTESFIMNGKFDAKKAATRVELSNSAGTKTDLFKGYTFFSKSVKDFDYFGEAVFAEVVCLKHAVKQDIVIAFLPEDFTVRTEETVLMMKQNKKGSRFELLASEFDKPASDGSMLADPRLMRTIGLKGAATVRSTPVLKGLLAQFPGLKRQLGFDLVVFGGAIKADPIPYFESNEMNFFILSEARTNDKGSVDLARQVALRTFGAKNLKEAHDKVTLLTEAVESLDIAEVEKYIHLGKEGSEVEENEDPMVLDLFNANRELFLKDDSQRRRLRTYLRKQIQKYQYGKKVILEDAVWRHMVSDPYAMVHYLKQGKLGIVREVEEKKGIVGIKRDSGLTFYKGKLMKGNVVLYRSPFLHEFEARKLNLGNVTTQSMVYYNRHAKYFTGLMVFSIWDMHAEGMSGADYDGDQCIVTWNAPVVDNTPNHPLFLDYSVINETVVGGVPFKAGKDVDYSFFTEGDVNFLNRKGITFNAQGTFFVPTGLKLTWKIEELLWKASAYISMQMLTQNQVGMLTNASDTVIEYMTTVTDEKEMAKLDKLSLFLAAGVRWEVDKPKHGGAFYDALPFLKAITEGCQDLDEIYAWEKEFGIILIPFFIQNKEECRFVFSSTLYLQETVKPVNLLIFKSEEKSMIEANLELAEVLAEQFSKEDSKFYHLTSDTQSMIKAAIEAEELSDSDLGSMSYANLKFLHSKGELSPSHPMGIVFKLSKALKVLRDNLPERPNYTEQLAYDKEFSRLVKWGVAKFQTVESSFSDALLFALMYQTLIKESIQFDKTKDTWMLFRLFGKGALAFFEESKQTVFASESSDVSFVVYSNDNSMPVLTDNKLIVSNGMVEGYQISREDALTKTIEGVFIMANAIELTSGGLLLKGTVLKPVVDEDASFYEGSVYKKYLMEMESEMAPCPSGTLKETTLSVRVVTPEVGEVSDDVVVPEAVCGRTDAVDEWEELALDPEYSAWVMERQLEHAECMYAEELPEVTVEVVESRPSVKTKQAKNGKFARRNRFLKHKNITQSLAQSLTTSVNLAEAKQLSLFAQQD